jgi:hypothetical protein
MRLAILAPVAAIFALTLAGCGEDAPPFSGTYEMTDGSDGIGITFVDADTVRMTVYEGGSAENRDCAYEADGDEVTVTCEGGEARTMKRVGNALEVEVPGGKMSLPKK